MNQFPDSSVPSNLIPSYNFATWSPATNETHISINDILPLIKVYGSQSPYSLFIDYPFYTYDYADNLLFSHTPINFASLSSHKQDELRIIQDLHLNQESASFVYNELQDVDFPSSGSGWFIFNMTDFSHPLFLPVFVNDSSLTSSPVGISDYITIAKNTVGTITNMNFGYVQNFNFFPNRNMLVGNNGSYIWSTNFNSSYFNSSSSESLLFSPLVSKTVLTGPLFWFIDPLKEEIYALQKENMKIYQYNFNRTDLELVQDISTNFPSTENQNILDFAYNNETGLSFVLLTDENYLELKLVVVNSKIQSYWIQEFIKEGSFRTEVPSPRMNLDSDILKLFCPVDRYGMFVYDLTANSSLVIQGADLFSKNSQSSLFLYVLLIGGAIISLMISFGLFVLVILFIIKKRKN